MAFKELCCTAFFLVPLCGSAKQTAKTAIAMKFPLQFQFKLRGSTAAWFLRVFQAIARRS